MIYAILNILYTLAISTQYYTATSSTLYHCRMKSFGLHHTHTYIYIYACVTMVTTLSSLIG